MGALLCVVATLRRGIIVIVIVFWLDLGRLCSSLWTRGFGSRNGLERECAEVAYVDEIPWDFFVFGKLV